MSTAVLATPRKPWRPSFRQAIPELNRRHSYCCNYFRRCWLSAPLKGKLGFIGALFIVAIVVISALITGIRRDRKSSV